MGAEAIVDVAREAIPSDQRGGQIGDAAEPAGEAAREPASEPASEGAICWRDRALPVPPPSAREPRADATDVVSVAVRLLEAHAGTVAALIRRSPADFRPLPTLVNEAGEALTRAFDGQGHAPSLVGALAPLVAPRLERLIDHLRRRLARERALLPLSAVREMDPACLRRNALEPGRTLLEKAGPRQRLVAVRRVPRFDTMENRVLVASAARLAARAASDLERLRGAPLRRPLQRLARACSALLARPELEGIGPPRPGERPSNALLGDADYRAAWRAWQLLRSEEDRFAAEWEALETVWHEFLLLAIWAALDKVAEPMPEWLIVPDQRTKIGRVQTGAPRRWLGEASGMPVLLSVEAAPDRPIRLRRAPAEGATTTLELFGGLDLVDRGEAARLRDAASGETPSLALAARLAADLVGSLGLTAPPLPPRLAVPPAPLTGLCALDAELLAYDERGQRALGPSAAAELPVPNEAPLLVVSRAATWLACAGPEALHGPGPEAELGGALLARHAGRSETAVVVPDRLDEAGVTRLRRRLGRAWLVWSPVAAALALPEEPDRGVAEGSEFVGFIVLTDAALDVAVLERTTVHGHRLWIRSSPLPGEAAGRMARRFGPGSSDTTRAWLRESGTSNGITIVEDRPTSIDFPRPAEGVASAAVVRLAAWKGTLVTRIVAVGISQTELTRLSQALPNLSIEALAPEALARGALTFLKRRAAGLPTWKDRLPQLDLQVRVGRDRRLVTLVPQGQLIAPGDELKATPPEVFSLEHAKDRLLLDLRREGAPAAFALHIEGPPLPLAEPARVRIVVRYTYGLSGMTGRLVPEAPARFAPLVFTVGAAGSGAAEEAIGPPPLPVPTPTTPDDLAVARKALAGFEQWWGRLPLPERKRAAQQAGVLDRPLREALRPLGDALRTFPAVDSKAQRSWLEDEAAPALDWLLGLGKRRGAGDPPKLQRDLRVEVARLRADTRVRGTGKFASWIQEIPARDRLYALGRLVDGSPEALSSLLEREAPDPATQGEWARAVTSAFRAAPALARGLDVDTARALMARALVYLEGIAGAEPERHKEAIFRLACIFPWVCAVREHGLLPPSDPGIVEVREALQALYAALPVEARTSGGRDAVTQGDSPIAVAADWLAGRYASTLQLEDT